MVILHFLTRHNNLGFWKDLALEKERVWFFEIRRICFFSFLYFLFLVTFLLYVTFFFSLFLFVYFFSFISCILFISKSCILYPLGYIIFCLSKNPSKTQAKSKQNVKQTSKQNRNRVANVADIILSYTLIGYILAVSLFCFSFASTFA